MEIVVAIIMGTCVCLPSCAQIIALVFSLSENFPKQYLQNKFDYKIWYYISVKYLIEWV